MDIITERQFRERLGGVSTMYIYRHRNDDGFPVKEYRGNRKYYSVAEVDAYIASKSSEPTGRETLAQMQERAQQIRKKRAEKDNPTPPAP